MLDSMHAVSNFPMARGRNSAVAAFAALLCFGGGDLYAEYGKFDVVAINGKTIPPSHEIMVRPGDTFTLHWDIAADDFPHFPPSAIGCIYASHPGCKPPFFWTANAYVQADLTEAGGNPSLRRPRGELVWKTSPTREDDFRNNGWLRTGASNEHLDPRANLSLQPGEWHFWMGSEVSPTFSMASPVTAIVTVHVGRADSIAVTPAAAAAGAGEAVHVSWRLDESGAPAAGDRVDLVRATDGRVVQSFTNAGTWTPRSRLPLAVSGLAAGSYEVRYTRGAAAAESIARAAFDVLAPGKVRLLCGDDFLLASAMDDLSDYLSRLTGQSGPLFTNAQAGAPAAVICVGRSAFVDGLVPGLDKLDLDGFVIRAVRRPGITYLVLAGRKPWGTRFAVTRYLMRFCDVRWLTPGELGLELPRRDGVPVPLNADLLEQPTTRSREFAVAGGNPLADRWFLRTRYAGAHHNLAGIVPVEVYGQSHPEYFALLAGARRPGMQACTSNSNVVRLATEFVRRNFEIDPTMLSFSLSSNDGMGYCECPECRSLDPANASPWSVTDRYYTFVNAVAEAVAASHPGRFIGVHAYMATADPPLRLKVRDNVLPFITLSYATGMTRPHQAIEHLRDWSRCVRQFGYYHYIYGRLGGDGENALFSHYPHALADLNRAANRLGCVAVAAEALPNWAQDAPKLWCFANLLWNDRADVDALMDDWCRHAYGPAARPMRRFFDRWEEAYESRGKAYRYECSLRWYPRYTDATTVVSKSNLEGMIRDLAEAGRLATEERHCRRIALVAEAFKLSRLFVEASLAQRELGAVETVRTPAEAGAAVVTVGRLIRLRQERTDYFRWLIAHANPLYWGGESVPSPERGLDNEHREVCFVAEENGDIVRALQAVLASGQPVPAEAAADPVVARLLAAARLLRDAAAAEAANLVRNPGFEETGADPSQPAAWTVAHNLQSFRPAAILLGDDTTARTGKRSVRVRGGSLSGDAYQQTVPVKEGEWYVFRAWVKGKLAEPSNEAVYLTTLWKGPGVSADWTGVGLPHGEHRDWKQLVTALQAPKGATSVRVGLEALNGPREGSLWCDDVTVARVP